MKASINFKKNLPPKKNLKSSFPLRFPPSFKSFGRAGKARRAEGESVGGIPPAEPSQFRSDIFKQTPPNASTVTGNCIRFRKAMQELGILFFQAILKTFM